MKKYFLIFIIIFFIVATVIINKYNSHPSTNNPVPVNTITTIPTPEQVLGQRTKISECMAANSLPDSACTPGAIFPNVTEEDVCTPGYAKSVRNVPQSIKNEVYREYNIRTHAAGQYEVDHLISLELGGSNDVSNLWPEAAEPRPGYHEKDKVENYLHDQVCSGSIPLKEAQIEIAHNWLQIYQEINH